MVCPVDEDDADLQLDCMTPGQLQELKDVLRQVHRGRSSERTIDDLEGDITAAEKTHNVYLHNAAPAKAGKM